MGIGISGKEGLQVCTCVFVVCLFAGLAFTFESPRNLVSTLEVKVLVVTVVPFHLSSRPLAATV